MKGRGRPSEPFVTVMVRSMGRRVIGSPDPWITGHTNRRGPRLAARRLRAPRHRRKDSVHHIGFRATTSLGHAPILRGYSRSRRRGSPAIPVASRRAKDRVRMTSAARAPWPIRACGERFPWPREGGAVRRLGARGDRPRESLGAICATLRLGGQNAVVPPPDVVFSAAGGRVAGAARRRKPRGRSCARRQALASAVRRPRPRGPWRDR